MKKNIPISELKPGMYVNLPSAWRAHPFLRNSFTITSRKQIQKLIDHGIGHVIIDVAKGTSYIPPKQEIEEPEKDFTRDLQTVASENLQEVVADKKMPPSRRAQAVHHHAADLMRGLLENPTGEKIAQFKKTVTGVVDLVFSDDAVSRQLMRITSYDYNTYIHSVNVGILATALAKEILHKQDKHDMHALGAGFFLHDIGKVHVDEAIINKEGKLTEEEMAIMRKHPARGFKLLNEAKQITIESRLVVLQHHERHNGTGYPRKLRGEDIHIYGRICSVADVFDALVSKRPYKSPLTPFDALQLMKEEMLDHFHKDVFEKFVLLFK
ncbi:MAG TPA: HD-GYP domain-containing protein [Smithellaceae bacterium]|nr:HD-GYP domain-containing protein [Smithellaceae bacterium]